MSPYRLQRLTAFKAPRFDLGAFSCGEEAYDRWLTHTAADSAQRRSASTYLLLGAPSTLPVPVLGYFALALTGVERRDLSNNMSGYVGAHWLLARMAVAENLRGGEVGRMLLRNALEQMVAKAEASRLLVVDIEHRDLAGLYQNWGFKSPLHPDDGADEHGTYAQPRRLVVKTSAVARSLEET